MASQRPHRSGRCGGRPRRVRVGPSLPQGVPGRRDADAGFLRRVRLAAARAARREATAQALHAAPPVFAAVLGGAATGLGGAVAGGDPRCPVADLKSLWVSSELRFRGVRRTTPAAHPETVSVSLFSTGRRIMADTMNVRAMHQQNRQAWNEGAARYEEQVEQDIAFLRAGGRNFVAPELRYLENLGDWCRRAIHLQCAGGRDTLSLWNQGAAEIVGVDISERMIACARQKSAALNAPAHWHCCDVLETPRELDGTADPVY